MFNFSTEHLHNILSSQANVFNSLHGAGDSQYEGKDLTTGIYRERKNGIDRSVPKIFVSTNQVNTHSNIDVTQDNSPYSQQQERLIVDEVFQKYKLTNITAGAQWKKWRTPKVSLKKANKLPPSAMVPYRELMIDIHEERMECLCSDLEEAPLSLVY